MIIQHHSFFRLTWICAVATLAGGSHAATLTDNFNVNANYLTNGIAGTIWDGVYFGAGEFNNSGIGGGGPIEDVPVDWVKSLFETNYLGAIRMIQAILPGMRERRSGAIVNVSSIAGRLAIAGHGHYSAVKHALEAVSEALAQEVHAFGIRVALVEPGVVVTPIFTKAKRFADPGSPYAVHVHRLLLFYQMQMKTPSQPADVARVIHEAVTAKEPRLRYLVGDDAERLVAGRQRLTDEEYVATGRLMPDAEYLDLMRQRYGFQW